MQRNRLTKLIFLSLLSGSAFIMQYLNFPLPPFPSFLQIDFSEIPALVAGLVYGPIAGVIVELIKNCLHFIFSGSETGAIPIGQLSNFVAGSIFVTMTILISRQVGQMNGLIYGMLTATFTMAIVMTIANWYVIFPAYSFLIHWSVTSSQKIALILYGVAPFNVVKGIIIAVIFIPIYSKLRPHLEQKLIFR